MTKKDSKKTVLIVDDERDLLKTVEDYFESDQDDFAVQTAENGREALEILNRRRIDVVVTDIKMPEMDGVTLLTHLMNNFPTIPCVVVTAYGTPELEQQLIRLGMVGLLEKPFDLADLRDRIMTALDQLEETGSLTAISLDAFLQILEVERQSGILEVVHKSANHVGYIYLSQGEMIDASFQELIGEEAVYEIISIPKHDLAIKVHLRSIWRERTIHEKMMTVLMEAMRRLDEKKKQQFTIDSSNAERSIDMSERTTTDVFAQMLEIPGLQAVVVIAKDGFVIESAGSARKVDIDGLGASVALVYNGVEQMGRDLSLQNFNTLTVEYGDALIVCQSVGDAVLAMVAPDSKTLGMIRFKSKKLVEELEPFF